MSIAAQCPTCGAPIEFRIDSSIVAVCGHCHAAVHRTDRGLQDVGRVSDLVATTSPLQLWSDGSYQGVGFQLVGRTQVRHGMGGVWDEWYLAFDDTRWGWLAEAQGRFYLTFQAAEPGAPPYESMAPGNTTTAGGVQLTVAERGEAELLGAEGEIPYRLEPNKRLRFADLVGPQGEFATVDYGDAPPTVYVGRQVSLADLGMASAALREAAATEVGAQAITCPNCAGSLELCAPDQAERVVCPYCDAVHDVAQGNLHMLRSLKVSRVEPVIPLGSEGTFDERRYKVIGFMQRSVTYYGVKYFWEEYLLYESRAGFRWLTCGDGHWSFVEPVNLATIEAPTSTYRGAQAKDGERVYTVFQDTTATVEYVSGEFYWKVEAGQTTHNIDFINPPYILSCEQTPNEANWSRGRYLTHRELDAAFADVEIPEQDRRTVAPNQPYRHSHVYGFWALFTAAAVLLIIGIKMRQANAVVHEETLQLEPQASGTASQVLFTQPFKLRGKQNLVVRAASPVSNSWVYLECDLVNTETGMVSQFNLPIEYYFGYSGGESWSEGSDHKVRYLAAVPKGEYLLRLGVWRKTYRTPSRVTVQIRQGVFRSRYWITLLVGLALIPIGVIVHHRMFEKKRWAESDFGEQDDSDYLGGDDDYYYLDD